jgi:hypothetical protein
LPQKLLDCAVRRCRPPQLAASCLSASHCSLSASLVRLYSGLRNLRTSLEAFPCLADSVAASA